MPKATIKFGKQTFQIQIQQDQTFQTFQAKVYALTTVPPKNMRLLNKGAQIKDDNAVKNIKQAAVLTLFGTKQSNIIPEKIQSKKQQPKKIVQKEKQYFGIKNIGNTCYLNSGIQLIRAIPQLKAWFFNNKVANHGFGATVNQLGDVIKGLQTNKVIPQSFVWNFLTNHSEFGPFGQQQDSEQLVQKFLFLLQKVGTINDQQGKQQNLTTNLFQMQFQDKLFNTQVKQQQPKISWSTALKLGCTTGGNTEIKIKNITQGIRAYLKDQFQKRSDYDNKMHLYQKSSCLRILPRYLIVQMIRFYWKQANEYSRTKATSTKICKPIDFDINLDLYQFCTSQLKEKLNKGRQQQRKNIQQQQKQQKVRYQIYKQKNKNLFKDQRDLAKQYKIESEIQQAKKYDQNLYREHGLGLQTGKYTLISAITHQGTTVDSGHYMSWAHKSGNRWLKFNDDQVTQHKVDDVLNLKGGLVTIEIAYILLYRRRQVI